MLTVANDFAAVGLLFLRLITTALHRKEVEERDREARLKGETAALAADDGAGYYVSRLSAASGAPGDSDDVLASAQSRGKDRGGVSYVSLG